MVNYTWWNPLSNPLPEVPSDRSETPEEAMASSLLSLVDPSSLTNLSELDELFCRDTEPFSELFEVTPLIIFLGKASETPLYIMTNRTYGRIKKNYDTLALPLTGFFS